MEDNKNKSEVQAQETVQVSYKEKNGESSGFGTGCVVRFGGFNFLESTVDGVQNLNPERKARKKIFLTDEQKQEEREALKNKIDMWIDLLNSSSAVTEMIATSKAKSGSCRIASCQKPIGGSAECEEYGTGIPWSDVVL